MKVEMVYRVIEIKRSSVNNSQVAVRVSRGAGAGKLAGIESVLGFEVPEAAQPRVGEAFYLTFERSTSDLSA